MSTVSATPTIPTEENTVSVAELRRCGWSDGEIEYHLGPPDLVLPREKGRRKTLSVRTRYLRERAKRITQSTLIERGWTKWLIREHLGEPDAEAPNPHYRWAGAPMRLYLLSRVEQAEEHPEVAMHIERILRLRRERKEVVDAE